MTRLNHVGLCVVAYRFQDISLEIQKTLCYAISNNLCFCSTGKTEN